MSSKQNDTNQIHLGNYEEYFILYMDNELTSEQMKMVDDFLASHPDLRGEFEILKSIKLPSEEFSINKDELYAGSMKAASFINEDLLLYVDNELSSDKTKVVELELNSNKEYHLQHQLLLKTKLDASETISYPNKEELYRRTEKLIAFKLWIRVAAAIILVAVLSFFYYKQTSVGSNNDIVKQEQKTLPAKKTENIKEVDKTPVITPMEQQNLAANKIDVEKKSLRVIKVKDADKKIKNIIPVQDPQNDIAEVPKLDPKKYVFGPLDSPKPNSTPSNDDVVQANVEPINKPFVTSVSPDRTTNGITQQEETVAKKGSVKGFLRKATRLIEKRTGFDPTNDGELLLGVVAVKLK